MQVAESRNATPKANAGVGLKTAINILEKWGVSGETGSRVLRVSRSTYSRAKRGENVSLDRDQLTRVSLVLNIHAALRVLFENPENLYGFMRMKNHNPFFNGRAPLEVIEDGDIVALYETFRRLDALRGAQW